MALDAPRHVGSQFPNRDQTHTPCITRWMLKDWTTREVSPLKRKGGPATSGHEQELDLLCHLTQLFLSKKRHRMYLCLWTSDKTETTVISEKMETNQMSPTSPAACLEWVSRPQYSCGRENRVKEGGWSPWEEKTAHLRSSRPPETSPGGTGRSCTKAKPGAMWGAVFIKGVHICIRKLPEPGRGRAESSRQNAERCHLGYRKTSPRPRLTRPYPAKLRKQTLEGSVSSNTWQTKT